VHLRRERLAGRDGRGSSAFIAGEQVEPLEREHERWTSIGGDQWFVRAWFTARVENPGYLLEVVAVAAQLASPEWLAQAIEPTNGVVDRIDLTVADLTRPDSPKA
jgi:hypothetical protein